MNDSQIDNLVNLIVKRIAQKGPAPNDGEHNCVGCPSNATGGEFGCAGLRNLGATRVGRCAQPGPRPTELRQFIDHTMLKPETTRENITDLCLEAKKYGFASVCVNPTWVRLATGLLKGSSVLVCTVVGFPLGATPGHAKAFEAREAIRQGAREVDMVINIGALKSKLYDVVLDDIAKVVKASHPHRVKVIIETSKLTQQEKIIACSLSKVAGAAFVKTSTGFGGGGATAEDVALMKNVVGDELEVKASGGIRNTETAQKMIAAGATRLGASASVAIVTGTQAKSGGY